MDFGTLSDTQKVPKIFGEKEECLLLSAKHITAHHSLLEREQTKVQDLTMGIELR